MKKLKNISIGIIVLGFLAGAVSCKKFLDRKPLGLATEGDLSQGGLQVKVFGLYGAMRNWGMTDFPMLWFKGIRSDDAQKGSTTGDLADGGQIMDNFQYTKDHWLMNAYWDDHYNFINLTNDIIHEVDSLGLTDPGSLINKAEAMFFRAYAYFDLVRDYGSVPKIDFKVYSIADGNKPKAPVAEIYALIDADLQFAAANLPLSWGNQFPGRLTKGTANTLWGKAYLYRQNWTAALAKLEEVIQSNQYSLNPSYVNFFLEKGENTSESILEVQMHVNNNGSVTIGNSHNQVQGVRGSGDWDLGWGFHVPTATLEAAYETGDPRRPATILYSGQPDGIYGRVVPTGLAQPFWNKKVYPDPARRNAITDRSQDGHFSKWMNIRLLRYADVLLMAAEAANEIGGPVNTTKALAWLEMVRARARGGNAGVLPAVTTTNQAQLRTAIQNERRFEFAMEWERFYDLVRWGLAPSVLGPLGYQARNRYYPIPQPAIDRSNGVLVQNPDYP